MDRAVDNGMQAPGALIQCNRRVLPSPIIDDARYPAIQRMFTKSTEAALTDDEKKAFASAKYSTKNRRVPLDRRTMTRCAGPE